MKHPYTKLLANTIAYAASINLVRAITTITERNNQ